MRQHLDVVAHGFRFYGSLLAALGLLGGAGMTVAALVTHEPAGLAIGVGVAALMGLVAVPWLWTGTRLLARDPRARTVGLVLSVFMLGDVPIGTSLGILGLGVLLDEGVMADFEREATRRRLAASSPAARLPSARPLPLLERAD